VSAAVIAKRSFHAKIFVLGELVNWAAYAPLDDCSMMSGTSLCAAAGGSAEVVSAV
jgi:hypothetical protein